MSDHGRANMRTGTPKMFGDEHSQQLYEHECEAVRAQMVVRFQVAPHQQVSTPNGAVLTAGTEVTVAKMHGGLVPAWIEIERLVNSGKVLEANSQVLSSGDGRALHRVAHGGSIVTLGGIMGGGRAVTAADLAGGDDALEDLVSRGAVVASK